MKTEQKVTAYLPMIMTFLATQHWLHGLILFILLGGSASQMMSMNLGLMMAIQRMMMIFTL